VICRTRPPAGALGCVMVALCFLLMALEPTAPYRPRIEDSANPNFALRTRPRPLNSSLVSWFASHGRQSSRLCREGQASDLHFRCGGKLVRGASASMLREWASPALDCGDYNGRSTAQEKQGAARRYTYRSGHTVSPCSSKVDCAQSLPMAACGGTVAKTSSGGLLARISLA
jgi:hypothetical protein